MSVSIPETVVKPAENKTGKEFTAVFGNTNVGSGRSKTAKTKSKKSSATLPLSTDRLLEDRIYLSILAGTMEARDKPDGDPRTRIEKSVQRKVRQKGYSFGSALIRIKRKCFPYN